MLAFQTKSNKHRLPYGRGSVRPVRAVRTLPALVVLMALVGSAPAATPSFTVGWSVYVGWNPYYYMAKSGILRKWADKYGINIRVQRFDYAPSLDAFVAKNIDRSEEHTSELQSLV